MSRRAFEMYYMAIINSHCRAEVNRDIALRDGARDCRNIVIVDLHLNGIVSPECGRTRSSATHLDRRFDTSIIARSKRSPEPRATIIHHTIIIQGRAEPERS